MVTGAVFAVWEHRARFWALMFTALTLLASVLIALVLIESGRPALMTLGLAMVPAYGMYAWQTKPIRRRRTILQEPFPREWEAVL